MDGWVIEKERREGEREEVLFLPGKKNQRGQIVETHTEEKTSFK